MAYIDVDKDIRYYTDPLKEKIDELAVIVKDIDVFKRHEGVEIIMNESWVGEEHSEDGSIRQDIKDLKSQMIDVDDELMELSHKIDGLLKLLKTIGD